MSSNNGNKTLHIVMYPWFALSHLTSFLRLANKLADRGHKITFILPNKAQQKLTPHNHRPHLITFIPITTPSVAGLPPGVETTNDAPQFSSDLLLQAMDKTKDTIDGHLANLKPDFVLFDFAMWLPSVARKHGAKSVYYATSNLVRWAYSGFVARNLDLDQDLTEADFIGPPPGFPNPELRLLPGEARGLAHICNYKAGGMTFPKRFSISLRECDAFGSKTCREIEGPYCDFLEKEWGKPLILAGPMVPEPPSGKLDEQFDEWLKGFGKGSVVYCALGSECVLKLDQFRELVLGFELTGIPFLAVLKKPIECETLEAALPEGFLERTKGRGIAHSGWVQQQLILNHPSVGCFVTHCGAGSLSEALLTDCQLVFLPQSVDQPINAKFMSKDLKVGVEVDKGEEDCFSTKEDVCNAILKVMKEDSEVGDEVRANHAKVRDVLLKEGLEDSYITGFIEGLRRLRG